MCMRVCVCVLLCVYVCVCVRGVYVCACVSVFMCPQVGGYTCHSSTACIVESLFNKIILGISKFLCGSKRINLTVHWTVAENSKSFWLKPNRHCMNLAESHRSTQFIDHPIDLLVTTSSTNSSMMCFYFRDHCLLSPFQNVLWQTCLISRTGSRSSCTDHGTESMVCRSKGK